jgi:hypothetical protein
MRRRRLLRWAKWTSTLAAGLALGAAVFSGLFMSYYEIVSADTRRSSLLFLGEGLAWCRYSASHTRDSNARPSGGGVGRLVRWDWGLTGDARSHLLGLNWRAGVLWTRTPFGWELGVSVVYPVLLTTIPAAFLWYKDRRRFGPHACKGCGYDRRGLPAEAKCPECGTLVQGDSNQSPLRGTPPPP